MPEFSVDVDHRISSPEIYVCFFETRYPLLGLTRLISLQTLFKSSRGGLVKCTPFFASQNQRKTAKKVRKQFEKILKNNACFVERSPDSNPSLATHKEHKTNIATINPILHPSEKGLFDEKRNIFPEKSQKRSENLNL